LFVLVSLVIGLLPLHTARGQTAGVQTPYLGIWISAQELAALPTSGTAWDSLLSAANASAGTPEISNQDSNNDVYVLAKALVFARTGETRYRTEVIDQLQRAMGTEAGGRTLALARNLVSYVIAADLVNLPAANPTVDQSFRTWLRKTLTETLDGRTLVSTQEDRPNNWGTHAGASRTAVALYLRDQTELNRAATVFRGLLGERAIYSGFSYGDLSWQCDASKPVGINPKGCMKSGYSIDGVIPDDMRRGGTFQMPPIETGYPWESLQGMTVQAMLLQRAGFPAFEWSDRAILRAVQYLYNIVKWPATGDDRWQVWLINYAYGTNIPAASPALGGKNMGWTDWTHSRRTTTSSNPAPLPTPQPTTAPILNPTAVPTTPPTSSSSNLIKAITFENGNLVDSTNGVDRSSGSVTLSSAGEMLGRYSVNIGNVADAYLQEDFSGVDNLFVSFVLKINALPSSASRLMLISNSGTTIGNLLLNPNGSLKLRSGSTALGSESAPLAVNTLYWVGLHQARGTGGNAVLEAFVAPMGQSFSAPFASIRNGSWTNQATFVRFGATMSAALNARFDDIVLKK
jgi:hypothetical protein